MTKPTVAVCSFASALKNGGANILQLLNASTSLKLISRVGLNVRIRAHTTNKVQSEENFFIMYVSHITW